MPGRKKRSLQKDSGGKFTKLETTGRARDKYLKAAIKAIKEVTLCYIYVFLSTLHKLYIHFTQNGQRRGATGEEIVQLVLVDTTLKSYRQDIMSRTLRAAVQSGKLERSTDGRCKLPHLTDL